MWVVYGEESGEEQAFATKKEAIRFVKEAMAFDKENGLVGEKWSIRYERG